MPTVLHIDGEAMTYKEEIALEEMEAQERRAEEEDDNRQLEAETEAEAAEDARCGELEREEEEA